MPDLDERIRAGLGLLAQREDGDGDAFDRVATRMRRRRRVRRAQNAALSLAVLALTAGGIFGLVRAFGSAPSNPPEPAAPLAVDRIAFVRSPGDPDINSAKADVFSMNPDGSDVVALTHAAKEGMVAAEPAWSSDGTKLAIVQSTSDHFFAWAGTGDIVVIADGTGAKQLTSGLMDAEPTWSPDGSRLAFVRGQGQALYTIGSDGRDLYKLTVNTSGICSAGTILRPDWSPDGREILFQRGCDGSDIWAISPDGTGLHLVSPSGFDASSPAWSPDGERIAFVHADALWIMDADGSNPRPVTECKLPSCVGDSDPSWSPDGSRLAFVRDEDGGNDFQLWVVGSDGSDPHALTTGPQWNQEPAWNPAPATTPTPQPPHPTPTQNVPSDDVLLKEIGPACDATRVTADFDGDGAPDAAVVFYPPPPDGLCNVPWADRKYQLFVSWSSGNPQRIDLSHLCNSTSLDAGHVCRSFAGPDLNGDGKAELAIQTNAGVSVAVFAFMTFKPDAPVMVSAGGVPKNVSFPQTLRLTWGTAATHSDVIRCVSGSHPELVAVSSELDERHDTWKVAQTPFRFDGPSRVVLRPTKHTSVRVGDPDARRLQAGPRICGASIQATPVKGSSK
jgi:TolB protein